MGLNSIGVVGLGYVGLPTALAFHKAGMHVTGIDISEEVIRSLESGKCHLIDDTESLEIPTESERWRVCSDFNSIGDLDVILITVPTPVSEEKKPDLSHVKSASKSVLGSLKKGSNSIVVLESTVYPGVTRTILGGICDDLGLKQGVDVTLAYCPERIDPGTAMRVGNISRIVGCDDPIIGSDLADIYGKTTIAQSTYVGAMEVAEAAKMVENLQRDIDIALVNELSKVFPKIGIDTEDVLDASATKWNFRRFKPGIGVGGHCIPVDPYYYIQIARDNGIDSQLALSARQINESMPSESALRISEIIGKGNVLILGYAYKENLGDTRETPVEQLSDALIDLGIGISIWDPIVKPGGIPERFERIVNLEDTRPVDMIVLSTAHQTILEIDWDWLKTITGCSAIFDGRRSLNKEEMIGNGWKYSGAGAP